MIYMNDPKKVLRKNGMNLQYISMFNQTEELCLLAVEQNGLALQYVAKQTTKIVLAALKQNQNAAQYIDSKLLGNLHILLSNEVRYV